ncbi:hypothetical protein, partial [Mucilaginibacter polytrichastri]
TLAATAASPAASKVVKYNCDLLFFIRSTGLFGAAFFLSQCANLLYLNSPNLCPKMTFCFSTDTRNLATHVNT